MVFFNEFSEIHYNKSLQGRERMNNICHIDIFWNPCSFISIWFHKRDSHASTSVNSLVMLPFFRLISNIVDNRATFISVAQIQKCTTRWKAWATGITYIAISSILKWWMPYKDIWFDLILSYGWTSIIGF